MRKNYKPSPVDTSGVRLTDELVNLSEMLARNTHEVWAQARMSQGWTWGETRNDAAKTHPDLIPYEELDENEKDYDRNTSMQTLKVILSMGYDIINK